MSTTLMFRDPPGGDWYSVPACASVAELQSLGFEVAPLSEVGAIMAREARLYRRAKALAIAHRKHAPQGGISPRRRQKFTTQTQSTRRSA